MTLTYILRKHDAKALEDDIEEMINREWQVINAFYAQGEKLWCALLTREVDPCD